MFNHRFYTSLVYLLAILLISSSLLFFAACVEEESTISGTVFNDLNGNGERETDDVGIEDVIVSLSRNEGDTMTLSTDESGYYSFDGLAEGEYLLSIGINLDGTHTTEASQSVTLPANSNYKDGNFGIRLYNVSLQLQGLMFNEAFEMNTSYTNHDNQRYKLERITFYLSRIMLVNENGEEHQLSLVELYDMNNPRVIGNILPEGNYTHIKFGLGLDETLNNADPTTYPAGYPLSYTQADHYWTWAKYIFAKIEGRLDEDLTGDSFSYGFLYHTGRSQSYREVSIERNFTIANNNPAKLELILDVDRLFYNDDESIDMIDEAFTHSNDSDIDIAIKIMDNFAQAIR